MPKALSSTLESVGVPLYSTAGARPAQGVASCYLLWRVHNVRASCSELPIGGPSCESEHDRRASNG
jgi:hypothetical protein